MTTYETTNLNLAKLLEMFGCDPVYNVDEYEKETLEKFCFDIPENSALDKLLKTPEVVDFLEGEENKFKKLREPLHSQPTEGPAMDLPKPAFADLVRLSGRVAAFSGVQNWDKARNVQQQNGTIVQLLGSLLRGFFGQFPNNNASQPDEYRTIAVVSRYSRTNNNRFGEDGLTFSDLIPLLLSRPVDFGSVWFADKLDPRMADLNYNETQFSTLGLAFCLSSAMAEIGTKFFRDSSDPDPKVQEARELFAEQTRLFNEGIITEAQLDEARSQLNRTIAEIKRFFRSNGNEAEYNEMHLPAGLLLVNGYFCTYTLQQSSLDQYKKLVVFREFLSAEGDATPQQKELLCEMFEGTTEAQQEMLRNPQEMRNKYLAGYTEYFKGIVDSHQKRVEKLVEENNIEAALVLAMQAGYFAKFSTTSGIREKLKEPFGLTIFHEEGKDQEEIPEKELSSLLDFNLETIINSDLVKSQDKEDFKRILYHLYIREINKFFCTTDSSINPTFPPEILGADGKLDLSKFLQVEKTQDLLKPYFKKLDEKSHSIKEKQKSLSSVLNLILVSPLLVTSMAYVVIAIAVPPFAPAILLAVALGVAAIGVYAGTKLYHSAELQQIENLRKEGKEITLPTACKQVISREVATLYKTITCSAARTLSCIRRRTPPNTAISGATAIPPQILGIGINEEDVISV